MIKIKVTVIGSGSWGTALSLLLNKNGHKVTLWSFSKDQADELNFNRENIFLKKIKIHKDIFITHDCDLAVNNSDFIVISVPSNFIRETLERFKFKKNQILINSTKGIEDKTFFRMTQIIEEYSNDCEIGVLHGPTHAEEVALELPTACVIAFKNFSIAKSVQNLFSNNFFRVYTSKDIVGIELGGALKNIIALASGISDGLGFGDNAKAAIISRGIAEISRLGEKLGALKETFYGLGGIGDLIVTCISKHSRNGRAGILLGKGLSLKETLDEVKMVVEGVNSTKAVKNLSDKLRVEMPIVNSVNDLLYKNKSAHDCVTSLFSRDLKNEF
ncbi:MAG: NAD(P)-dependent glycerol-3-phosphate dehydrogenase [Clostridiales bacterium]|nr:NAD(P)-dependent glycerol-3-phosphate dehydrogenase [Clostridiales bacterium]